jgi:hypothetical protein
LQGRNFQAGVKAPENPIFKSPVKHVKLRSIKKLIQPLDVTALPTPMQEINVRSGLFADDKPLEVQLEKFNGLGNPSPPRSRKSSPSSPVFKSSVEELFMRDAQELNIVMQNGGFSLKSPRRVD